MSEEVDCVSEEGGCLRGAWEERSNGDRID